MDRHSIDWNGPIPAVVTPFALDRSIDEAAFARNVENVLGSGAHGIVVAGCTGEFWSLADTERARLFHLATEVVGDRGFVIAGVSAIEVDRVVSLAREARAAGCDGALVLPPWFVQLNDDDITAHFTAVAKAVDLPLMVYNIPANAVNRIGPALASRLAGIETVVAIKESSGDWLNYYETFLAVQDRLRVFCGPSHLYGAQAALMGCDGVIDIFPNVWLGGCNRIFHAAKAGRLDEAFALQEQGFRLSRAFTAEAMSLYVATKHAMNVLGLPGGAVRPPFHPLTGQQAAFLEELMRELGLT